MSEIYASHFLPTSFHISNTDPEFGKNLIIMHFDNVFYLLSPRIQPFLFFFVFHISALRVLQGDVLPCATAHTFNPDGSRENIIDAKVLQVFFASGVAS